MENSVSQVTAVHSEVRKRGRPTGSKNKPKPEKTPEIPPAAEPVAVSSGNPDAFDRAAEQVLNENGGGASAPSEQSTPQGEILPNFEKIAKFVIPKPFQLLALMLDEPGIDLSELQKEILVPMGAGAIEEMWPFLPDFFKNTAFPKLYAFGVTLAVGASPNFALAWKTYQARKQSATGKQNPKDFNAKT